MFNTFHQQGECSDGSDIIEGPIKIEIKMENKKVWRSMSALMSVI